MTDISCYLSCLSRLKLHAIHDRLFRIIESSCRFYSIMTAYLPDIISFNSRLSCCMLRFVKKKKKLVTILLGLLYFSKALMRRRADENIANKSAMPKREEGYREIPSKSAAWLSQQNRMADSLYLPFGGTLFFFTHDSTRSSRICIEIGW